MKIKDAKDLHAWCEAHDWPDLVLLSEEDFDWLMWNAFNGYQDHGALKFVKTEFRVKPKVKIVLDLSEKRVFVEKKKTRKRVNL